MKTYALQRAQDPVRRSDADTGEMRPRSMGPGPVPQRAPSANPAVQLQEAVRARRQEMEILRSAREAADAARSRAEKPESAGSQVEIPAAERIDATTPAVPVADIDRLSLPELLLLRPVPQAPQPAAAPEPESPQDVETPPEAEVPEEPPPEPAAEPKQGPEDKEPTVDKIQAPRGARTLGQVTPGSSPRVSGPLVFETRPPEPAGDSFRPADTPPGGTPPPQEPTPTSTAPAANPPTPEPAEEPEPEPEAKEQTKRAKGAEPPPVLEEPAAAEPEPQPEEQPEEEPEEETKEEVAADKAEKKAGVDPNAPPDEPLDRDAVEDLEIGEEMDEPAPGGPGGGGAGAAPELDTWKARATQAAVDIEKPDLGPPVERTKGMAEHGKKTVAAGRKRRLGLPKEAKPVLVKTKREVSDLGKVPKALQDDPVGAAKSIQAAARGKVLDAQRLPLLRPTPQKFLPNLYGDPVSPADFAALKKTYAKKLAAAQKDKKDKNKPYDEMAALLDAFKEDLGSKPHLKGRIAVFESQEISDADLPPKVEVAPAHKADVAAVLARIVTESEKIPDAWIKRARDLAYANKALSRPYTFPDIGADWTPKEAELLRAEIQRVRDAAGISKVQLDKAIEDRQEQLKKDKGASLKEGNKVYKEVKGKMEADYELTLGSIEGVRQEWEDWADERAARDSKVDWKAIRERQRAMEKTVRDMAADWIVGYDDMRKARLQKLQMAAGKQKKAYEAALAKDKDLLLQKEGADEKKIDETNKAFLDARMKEIGTRIGELDKANRKTVADWQKDMRTEREHALERLQTWGDKQIKRERSWFDKIIARVFRWRDEQKSEANAFAKQRAGETVADMGTHLQALNQVHLQFGDSLDEDEKAKLKTMSKEQRALVEKYYANGKDAIGLVAERLKIRLRNQRVPKIKQAMIKQVMAIPNNSTRGLKVAHLAKALNEDSFGAAIKARSGFEHTWGTHEERVYAAMRLVSSPVGAKGLRAVYFNSYGEDFDTRLKSELAGGWPDNSEDHDKARSILEQDKVGEAAADLRISVEGAGTSVAKINEALRRFPPGPKRKEVLDRYKTKYNEDLEDRIKSEMTGLEEDVSVALVKNKDAKADAIEVRQGQFAITTSGSREDMEKVYARIRKEEYERARAESSENLRHEKKPVSAAQIEVRIKARQLALGKEYKTAFKMDFEKSVRLTFQFEPQAADLVLGLQNQDFKTVDAARLEIERRGLYADDDTINDKVLKIQHQRAYERHKYDAEIQLQKEESDYLRNHPGSGPMLAADRLKRKEQLLKQASDKARADASKSMTELKGFYMRKYGQHYPKYMGGGSTDPAAFDKVIKGLTQGKGEDEAVERVEGNGYLVPHRELYYAVKNGDKDAIKALLNGKSLDEITAIQEKYQNDPSIKPKPDFKKDVLGQLSGRDRNDMKIQLEHGEPTDPATALEIAKAKLDYERRTGGVRGGVKRERYRDLELLVDRLREDKERYEAARADPTMNKVQTDEKTGVRYFANPAMGAYQNSWQAGIRSVNEIVDVHRQEVDAETDLIANLLAMTAAVVVGALLAPFTAGASLGLILLIAGAIAAASTAATMATKWALKGDAYSKDEITMDLAFGVVDFVVTAVTLGAGKFVAPMLKAATTGKTTVKEAMKQTAKQAGKGLTKKGAKRAAINQAQTEAAQGLFATIAVPAFMDEYGKGLNPLASTLLTLGLTMGSGIAVGKGMQRMQRARPADFDFSAQAKTKGKGKGGDLIELRGNPDKLKSMQDAYLKDNPHRTAQDFLKDYDDILLKMMKDQDFKAKWQKSARKDLLQDIDDPKVKQQLAETPVDLISDKEFVRLTGSKKGYAVVMIKDGVPTVVLRQGAPTSALREEGQHLLQAVQKKWAGHFKMLDETKLRDWKLKDPREKLVAYDAKLDLEIDANERYLRILQDQAAQAEVPPNIAAEIADIELMLQNLYRRQLELTTIGPLRRTLMGWGSIFEPQYLREKPRLFAKKAKPGAPAAEAGAPGKPGDEPRERVILEPYSGPNLASALDLARSHPDARVITTEATIKPKPGEARRLQDVGGTFLPENMPASIPVGSVDEIKMRFPIPHERAIQQDFPRRLAALEQRFPDRPRGELMHKAMAETIGSAETATVYAPYALQRLKSGGSLEVVFWERQIRKELEQLGELRFMDPGTGNAYRFEVEPNLKRPKGEVAPHSGFGVPVTNESLVNVTRLRKVEVEGADLADMRYDPKRLANMRDQYLQANPGRTADDFLRDYDALLLKQMEDTEVRARWQSQAREDMLQYVPKEERARFADTPIEMMDDRRFYELTGSETGQAVVMIKDGQPTVIVRQGASPTALRREAPHLLQSLDEKWKGHFRRLDEANLADWPNKDIREKLGLYKDKLEVEIDAAKRDLEVLRARARQVEPPFGIEREIAELERTLRNLHKRRAEVKQIGPLRRTLMAWGLWPEPLYLRQKPRLFSKSRKGSPEDGLPIRTLEEESAEPKREAFEYMDEMHVTQTSSGRTISEDQLIDYLSYFDENLSEQQRRELVAEWLETRRKATSPNTESQSARALTPEELSEQIATEFSSSPQLAEYRWNNEEITRAQKITNKVISEHIPNAQVDTVMAGSTQIAVVLTDNTVIKISKSTDWNPAWGTRDLDVPILPIVGESTMPIRIDEGWLVYRQPTPDIQNEGFRPVDMDENLVDFMENHGDVLGDMGGLPEASRQLIWYKGELKVVDYDVY